MHSEHRAIALSVKYIIMEKFYEFFYINSQYIFNHSQNLSKYHKYTFIVPLFISVKINYGFAVIYPLPVVKAVCEIVKSLLACIA